MLFSVFSDLSSIVIWILVLIQGYMGAVVILAAESMFAIIDTYGIFEWKRMKQKQRKGWFYRLFHRRKNDNE